LLVKLEIVIGMGGTDAKDILGLPRKTPLSLTQEKRSRPRKESHRKPDGISRENPSFFQVAWQWLPVKSSARSDDLQLFHWVWTKEETDQLFELCERFDLRFTVIADRFPLSRTLEELKDRYYSEWLMMFHHQSVDVLKYTDDEYENHLTDPVWTKEETDQLFELCERFDLRFTVIADRFPLSRTLEELKDRYYSESEGSSHREGTYAAMPDTPKCVSVSAERPIKKEQKRKGPGRQSDTPSPAHKRPRKLKASDL
ncbi:hypothetical protein HID58_061138, partial [Brassica napus]